MNKTELIASWKLVTTKNGDKYVVTTNEGNTVWCSKTQFDTNSEQITFKVMKAGDEYIKSDKTKGILKADRNEFLGCGKQIIKKHSTMEVMKYLVEQGVTPQFSMS
jgi:hypothetical protein